MYKHATTVWLGKGGGLLWFSFSYSNYRLPQFTADDEEKGVKQFIQSKDTNANQTHCMCFVVAYYY